MIFVRNLNKINGKSMRNLREINAKEVVDNGAVFKDNSKGSGWRQK